MSITPTSFSRARRRSAGLAVGVLAGLAGAVLGAAPASAATGDPFAALRQCEAGGNYAISTGNGFYGAYQFDAATWHGLGYSGLPHQASPATQDAAARTLQSQRGWAPWPGCSAKLGLSSYAVAAPAAPAAVAPAVVAARSQAAVSRSATRAAGAGSAFTVAMVGQVREDVRAWQAQMDQLGYSLAVDGKYGPASAAATRAFEASHGLTVDGGVVGPQVRAAIAQALGGA